MTAHARIALPNWPRLMAADMAARYLGIGATTLRATGLEPKRYGARVLYDRHDLDRWADALSGEPLDDGERAAEAGGIARRIKERLHGPR